jgi:alkylresorcinol/alkylpyrone synthase
MAELLSIAVALPEPVVTLEDTKARIAAHIDDAATAARYQRMAESTRIARRHVVLPVDETLGLRTIEERQTNYARCAVKLSEDSAKAALDAAGVSLASIRWVVAVSCTGYMMPSLDVHLAHRLGINDTARRVPITELGCSASVAAVGLVEELMRGADRDGNALVVSTELSSLCLQTSEPSISDVIGGLLFGDASASMVISAADAGRGLRIVRSRSVLWPETTHDLGMHLTTTGFRLDLSRHVPRLVRKHLRRTVESFLADDGLGLGDVAFWAIHPGGPKLMDSIAQSLGLSDAALRPTWDVWERCGNVSSATALVTLHDMMEKGIPPGARGLLLAPGPGLTCEMVLLQAPARAAA